MPDTKPSERCARRLIRAYALSIHSGELSQVIAAETGCDEMYKMVRAINEAYTRIVSANERAGTPDSAAARVLRDTRAMLDFVEGPK